MADAPGLVIDAVTVRNADTVFVSDLSLSVRHGEVLGITGPSGSGKSSVVHALAGLDAAATGRLLLGDRPLAPRRDVALGLILQHHHLPGMLTAHEAVSLPLQVRRLPRSEVAERSDRMLVTLGLGDHAHQLIAELSGGQRQRVAVARALAGDPELIIADEPTAGLDPDSHAIVVDQLLTAARAGAIVIIASSDPGLVGSCTRVVTLSEG